ncbi:MAG: efflux RND transporter periplasmic adaptor subunit [Planctomycetes bacterium]|nr:efflux RND transporter periplasmic adaptor subunit [Planctomycetota bacterium]MBI3845405.1 efflux RND transporter periplasmic adaptor subunit [Planctomycetota bacterium]
MSRRPIVWISVTLAIVCVIGVAVCMLPDEPVRASATEGSAAAISVTTATPQRRTLHRTLVIPGDFLPHDEATLYAKVAGYVKAIRCDIGDSVSSGQTLVELDVPELRAEIAPIEADVKQSDALLARARAEEAMRRTMFERLRGVRQKSPDLASQESLDDAAGKYEVAKADVQLALAKVEVSQANGVKIRTLVDDSILSAPISGVVTERFVDVGDLVQVATSSQKNVTPAVRISRLDLLRLRVHVPEIDVPFIAVASAVSAKIRELPGATLRATVSRIAYEIDRDTRNMIAEIDVPNVDGRLHPGMYAEVTVELEAHENALVVPAEALVAEKKKLFVFVADGNRAKKVELKTGLDDGIVVEVLNGLRGDERVILGGKGRVADGSTIAIVEGSK